MPDLTAVYTAVQARRIEEAQTLLTECPGHDDSPGWWQMQGLIYSTQGDMERAEQALVHGLTLSGAEPRTAGRLHFELGVLHGKAGRRDDALQAYLHAGHLGGQHRDHLGLLALSHNLAWSLLEVDRLEEAATRLDEAVLAPGWASGHSYHSLVQCGRSLVARLQGDQRLALSRAELARSTAFNATIEARAVYLMGQALWRLGNLSAAEEAFETASAITPEVPAATQINLTLCLLRERVPEGMPFPGPRMDARVRLHQAAWAFRRSDSISAASLLEEALGGLSQYDLRSESSLLPDLFQWALRRGYSLPEPSVPPSRVVAVRVRNPLELRVNGRLIKPRVFPEVAALVAYLRRFPGSEGRSARLVATEGLGIRARRLERAVDQLNVLIGEPRAVDRSLSSEGVERLSLSEHWTWEVDRSGRGTVLGGLDSPLATELTNED